MNGILLVDKPEDWTSNDVVQKLRGVLHERRIGHAGTLDPMATGLLTVFVGRATRAVEFAEQDRKRYLAGLRLGLVTDTQDITGRVLEEREVNITLDRLERVLQDFQGDISQIPPMYSAVKVQGKRLYKLAREGKTVERAARNITVYRLDLLSYDSQEILLDVRCSKGTYVRTLCHDIGEALGCGGCLSSLRRTEAGVFNISQAFSLEEIIAGEYRLLPTDTLFQQYPAWILREDEERRVRNGGAFHSEARDGYYRLYAPSGQFLALGLSENENIKTVKSFFEV